MIQIMEQLLTPANYCSPTFVSFQNVLRKYVV